MPRRPRTRTLALTALTLALAACGGGGEPPPRDPGDPGSPPAAPATLTATATSSTGVSLAWAPPAGTLTGFDLERATASGGPFAQVASPPGTASGYADGGLATGTTYFYRVRARNADGASPWSAAASATPQASAPAAPAAPAGLTVTAAGAYALRLDWEDRSGDETGFQVERANSAGGPFGAIHVTAAGAQTFTDSGLSPSTAYHYRVRAVNGAGVSAFTATAGASTAAAPPVPAPPAPTNLAAAQEVVPDPQAGLGIRGVLRVSWTDAATDETGYEVERLAFDGTSWTGMAAIGANATAWVDPAPFYQANTYRVRAVNASGASPWAEVTGYNGPILAGYFCATPAAPQVGAVTATSIPLSWAWQGTCDVAVERASTAGGPWAEVRRVVNPWFVFPAPTTGAWEDTGLASGATYHYRLRAVPTQSGWLSSGPSPVAEATTAAAVAAPQGLAVTVLSATSARFTWSDVAGEEGYALDYATAADGPFTEIYRLAADSTAGGAEGFEPATAYWVRVRATKGGASAAGTPVAFTTAGRAVLRTTGDATVMMSTALSSNQNVNLSTGTNDVGCYFSWVVGPAGQGLFHNCGGSALRFDTSSIAGREVLAAALVMQPCALAPHPVNDATYRVSALAGPWNPATVTFNTLPLVYPGGSLPAPTAAGAQVWDVTAFARNWASGTWASHGLYVDPFPVVDRIPSWGGQQWDSQDQVTRYCSLEQNGGSPANAPALWVDYR